MIKTILNLRCKQSAFRRSLHLSWHLTPHSENYWEHGCVTKWVTTKEVSKYWLGETTNLNIKCNNCYWMTNIHDCQSSQYHGPHGSDCSCLSYNILWASSLLASPILRWEGFLQNYIQATSVGVARESYPCHSGWQINNYKVALIYLIHHSWGVMLTISLSVNDCLTDRKFSSAAICEYYVDVWLSLYPTGLLRLTVFMANNKLIILIFYQMVVTFAFKSLSGQSPEEAFTLVTVCWHLSWPDLKFVRCGVWKISHYIDPHYN